MGVSLASSSGARSRRSSRKRAAMAEINVTPLVDVMLVLLIIFMVTVTLPAVGVPIELPESRANPVEEAREQVTISIDSDGRVYIGDDAVPTGALPDALATLDRNAAGELPTIVLRGDRSLDYGRVMAVMGELGRAGFTSISLVTDGSVTPP
ncbi:protein TolR [Erythrobacter sp. KY5]|uniref:ExbD/TolR family protein n=1 Tax=Erythrobacter sp. KY5 TaxID=2011159 RepID=UPI000DBEF7CB|nr:biopolymer transporter ExbD [Erythrobacter sp. KY5]AWW75656.1 protein TolR [Erythrobacter sp. KY5]